MPTGMLLTDKGVILHGKVQLGAALQFTKIEIGSGQPTEGQDITDLTAMISSKMVLTIQSATLIGDGKARLRCTATNTGLATGFYLREIGIFATDPDDGEILYAICNFGDQADYFPAENGPVAVEHQIDTIIVVGNAANVSISVISESLITQLVADFEEHRTLTPIDHPDGSVVDVAIGNRTIDDTVEAAAGAGTLTNLLSKIGYMIKAITGKSAWYTPPATSLEEANEHFTNTSNPHATTAVQVAALPIAGGTMTGAINEAKGSDIASASTCNIAAATGNYVRITGTATISSLGTAPAGARRVCRFSGSLTLVHNSTSLILPGGANITTAAGDIYEFTSEGNGNWRCTGYLPAAARNAHGQKISNMAAGTSSGDAVNLGQFANSFGASSGWQKLPGGLILQWGFDTTTNSTTKAITYPIAFPNQTLWAGGVDAVQDASSSVLTQSVVENTISETGFTMKSSAAGGTEIFRWLALGR